MGALDLLFNSEKVNIASNEELKKLLITWPGLVNDVIKEEIILREISFNRFQEDSNNYLSNTNIIKHFK